MSHKPQKSASARARLAHLAYPARFDQESRTPQQRRWVMSLNGRIERFEISASVPDRMRGMLFREPDEVTRLLVPCHDIHTFGMRYPLDVAFISKEGDVLEVHRNVSARKRLKRKGASMVAERFSQSGDWLKAGDKIRLGASHE